MHTFWDSVSKPMMVVAPMADVTDVAFRRMIAKYSAHTRRDGTIGGPDVMWTEFVAADGLVRATPEGKEKLMLDLLYAEEERPIVAQLFSATPEHMRYAAALCRELGFDGVDINMGCPDRSIEKQGCGAAMITTPDAARAVIRAAKEGARMGESDGIPVSVKTRIGYTEDTMEEWLAVVLGEEPAAVTIHGRTRKQLSKVPAQWNRIADAVRLRDSLGSRTKILGNGDVLSLADAHAKAAATGVDGVMVGRALFGNPWFFHPDKRVPVTLTALPTRGVDRDDIVVPDTTTDTRYCTVTVRDRLAVLVEHTQLFVDLLASKNFAVMKKHYKAYVQGFPGARELRMALMEAHTVEEVAIAIDAFVQQAPRDILDSSGTLKT